MTNLYYVTHKVIKCAYNINFESRHKNHTNIKLTNFKKYLKIEKIHVSFIVKQIADISARFKNQNDFKYQTVFTARSDKQDKDEDDAVLVEIEFYITVPFYLK